MNEEHKLCTSCREKCKQESYLKILKCPAYCPKNGQGPINEGGEEQKLGQK